MTGLIIKLFVCPITVIIASLIFPNVSYENLWQPIVIGFILAAGAHMMEVFFLKEKTFWSSTFMDFGAAFLIVYIIPCYLLIQMLLFLGLSLQHFYLPLPKFSSIVILIQSGKTQKSPA